MKDVSAILEDDGDIIRSVSVEKHVALDSTTPEELRQQSVEEKNKYKALKAEGKSEEALKAFKRSKELERQAGALEIARRKRSKMASSKASVSHVADNTQNRDESKEPSSQKNLVAKKGKEEKVDLASELRELGWSDEDIHVADKKPEKLSLEGELSNLIGEIMPKPSNGRKTTAIDKSEVTALKRKALTLKREGKLAEAKEELKRAKILEKQLEEQELLGEAEESDDELSVLIRGMDDDPQDGLLMDDAKIPAVNFEDILGASDDFAVDGNFEVTEDDMNDPDLAAALQSVGWAEDDRDEQADQGSLQEKVLTLKREALLQKRAGNVVEAKSLLKEAKELERDLEATKSDPRNLGTESKQKFSLSQVSETSKVVAESVDLYVKPAPKSKMAIQKELLAIKKKALALRREGKLSEAEEELKKGKILEQQLEEMENASKIPVTKSDKKNLEAIPAQVDFAEEGVEAQVTDQDMKDPALLSVLKNLGWNEDDDENGEPLRNNPLQNSPPVISWKATKSKGEIQKELLALKRKALALRREGRTEEAEAELEKAKVLEKQMAEMEVSSNTNSGEEELHSSGLLAPQKKHNNQEAANQGEVESHISGKSVLLAEESSREHLIPSIQSSQSSNLLDVLALSSGKTVQSSTEETVHKETHQRIKSTKEERIGGDNEVLLQTAPESQLLQQKEAIVAGIRDKVAAEVEEKVTHGNETLKEQILSHKRRAVALKREGKLAEAREALRQAKLLEKSLEDGQEASVGNKEAPPSASVGSPSSIKQDVEPKQSHKPISSRDRFKIQQESLSHKRNALKLRREGKVAEAEAEFELAKALESQLEESEAQSSSKSEVVDDAAVEDLLDPQLLSALKSIGWQDSDIVAKPSEKAEAKQSVAKSGNSNVERINLGNPNVERTNLEEQIKAEKLRALNLKRAGKQAEALEALRAAKRLEKKLASLG